MFTSVATSADLLSRYFLTLFNSFHFLSNTSSLCRPFFQFYFSCSHFVPFLHPSLHPLRLLNVFFIAFHSTFPLRILLTVCPSVDPSVTSPPLLPFLCAPDLLSLCPITKSTGSSRRSCRRSSPSVRSSLTRVRGTSWHEEVCVFARVCLNVLAGRKMLLTLCPLSDVPFLISHSM